MGRDVLRTAWRQTVGPHRPVVVNKDAPFLSPRVPCVHELAMRCEVEF